MHYIRLTIAYTLVIPVLLLSLVYAFVPAGLLRLFGAKRASERWLRRCGHGIAMFILFALGVQVTVDGRENLPAGGHLCFVANHLSMLDIVAFVGPARLWGGIIAKAELKRVPIINFWCKAIGCVFIDRKSPHSSVKAILSGVQRLKDGKDMLIFPEGTRSKTGKIGELKKGSLKLATRAKATIVPLTIEGTREGLETLRGIRRVRAHLSIGTPIPTDGMQPEELEQLPALVYGQISRRYEELLQLK
jgi:1-acyl-sn-glycerol-3-phosphate acyltransferase